MADPIQLAVDSLPDGPLTEASLVQHIHPLFSRVLRRQELYLANHSLGRPLDRTADDLRESIDLWYAELDLAWDAWLGSIERYREGWAELVGAGRPDAIVPKTAAGQGLRAVLNALESTCPRVVTTAGEFDSIDFILKSYARKGRAHVRFVAADSDGMFEADRIIAAIDGTTDLVVVSAVVFASGQRLDGVDRIVRAARQHGARIVLDTYHAAGALPLDLVSTGADFAIGGSYKYVRGGAGACWLWVNPELLSERALPDLFTLDTGWFAKAGTMDFDRPDEPLLQAGGNAWLESTPPVLSFVQALAGLDLLNAIGMERIEAYNREQQAHLVTALEANGVRLRLIEPRGAFLTALSDDPAGDARRLRELGVVTDARRDASGAGLVRFCPDLLNTRRELDDAAEIAGQVLGTARV